MTDSTAAGFLIPAATPAPLEGQALLDFLQGVIVGITGLDGTLVRPVWQSEPPNMPDAGTAWCAFRITTRPSDAYPYIKHNADGDGADALQRHEELHVLNSFYDLGSGGQADGLCAQFRDGLSIAQNREILTLNNMGFVKANEPTPVPVIVKTRWLYRVDLEWILRRQIDRIYPVRTILSAHSTLGTDDGMTRQINVTTD